MNRKKHLYRQIWIDILFQFPWYRIYNYFQGFLSLQTNFQFFSENSGYSFQEALFFPGLRENSTVFSPIFLFSSHPQNECPPFPYF